MSTPEPLTPARRKQITENAKTMAVAWGQRNPNRQDAHQVAADFGARIAREDVPALLAEVDRLTAELAARREPSAAEVELCDRWMAKYGDDPARWPADVHEAYRNTLAGLLSGGQS